VSAFVSQEEYEMRKFGRLFVLAMLVVAVGSCDFGDAAEKILEQSAGCKDSQLGNLNEPDLPNCSKAVACCKFIKGECGEITLFDFPQEVEEACNLNESVLKEAIEQYQGIAEGECPAYLTEDACQEGVEETREAYRNTIDLGQIDKASVGAPSCKMIVENTIVPLNEGLGSTAKYLPAACEVGTKVVSPE